MTWHVRVLTREDDAPIAGARVRLDVRLGRSETQRIQGETDPEGWFRAEPRFPRDWAHCIELVAQAAGRKADRVRLTGWPWEWPRPYVARLREAAVPSECSDVDDTSDGTGSVGAEAHVPELRVPLRVQVACGAAARAPENGSISFLLQDALHFGFGAAIEPDGATERRMVPIGTYHVRVTAAGMAVRHALLHVDAAGLTTPRVLRLSRGRRVYGKVRDRQGRPVGGCHVQFSPVRALITPGGSTMTDADGRYAFDHVEGLCRFSCQAPGFSQGVRFRWIPAFLPWGKRVDVVMRRACIVRGRVVSADREPIAGIELVLHARGPGPVRAGGYPARTAPDGRFELRDLPLGPAMLEVREQRRHLVCREAEELELEFRLPREHGAD